MQPNAPQNKTWSWNEAREEAAQLVAADRLSDTEIAVKLKITRQTLSAWRNVTEFAARVEEHKEAIREAIRTQGIADVVERVRRKNADWERLQEIRAARAREPRHQAHPGGSTGLLIITERSLKQGIDSIIVEESRIDTALLAELDRLEEGVARELGQRVEKKEVEVRDTSIADSVQTKIDKLAAALEPKSE